MKDCKIVQDLLPNYVENLTTKETNHFIEEHLENCKDCKTMLENMKKELPTQEREKKEVNYMKKFNKKLNLLKGILIIILIVFIAVIARRTVIMVSLANKAEEIRRSDNYYAKLHSYQGDTLTVTESYHNGEDYLTTMNWFSTQDGNRKLIFYQKGEEKIFLSEINGEKHELNPEQIQGMEVKPITYVLEDFWSNLQCAFVVGIKSTYCNGRECYLLVGDGYERYIDKETGLVIRSIEKSTDDVKRETDFIVDYEYQFNQVTGDDLVRPNI